MTALDRIAADLRVLAADMAEVSSQSPWWQLMARPLVRAAGLDYAYRVAVLARKVEAQAEMQREGLGG